MPALDPAKIPLDGPHLIEASAGTGKTYTIATLFVRLVLERELPVDRILVVTFTEAAAAELRDRIRRRLRDTLWLCNESEGSDAAAGDPVLRAILDGRTDRREQDRERLAVAIRTFDEVAISTIHGFCHRVLHDSAFETGVGFDTELVPNQQPPARPVRPRLLGPRNLPRRPDVRRAPAASPGEPQRLDAIGQPRRRHAARTVAALEDAGRRPSRRRPVPRGLRTRPSALASRRRRDPPDAPGPPRAAQDPLPEVRHPRLVSDPHRVLPGAGPRGFAGLRSAREVCQPVVEEVDPQGIRASR